MKQKDKLEKKEKTKLQKVALEMLTIIQRRKLTPPQIRYVNKIVREKGNYQIPKAKRKLPDFLNPAEIYTVRKTINDFFTPGDMFMFNFLLSTGLRIGEFQKLLITDLDFHNNTIKVPLDTKTGNRHVPFPMITQNSVKLFIRDRRTGYLFPKSNLTRYTVRALEIRFKNIFQKSGLVKKLHPHSLRHTYATILRAKGVSIQDIQMYLGHSDIKTTQIYTHLTYDMEQQKQIMQIMDNT